CSEPRRRNPKRAPDSPQQPHRCDLLVARTIFGQERAQKFLRYAVGPRQQGCGGLPDHRRRPVVEERLYVTDAYRLQCPKSRYRAGAHAGDRVREECPD
ncbi:hypothetical protein ACFQ6Q_35325, partial [Streptomyces sp. NPDC056437]|uniref:hypothetical protein n=1 Tax=Streptomyces sp. NPDC056437 TaxID=3345816 RepID=UPI0036C807D3